MGILDDAIREHLDLKRQHGAREAELREIEDEAFGSGDQPDPFSGSGELFGEVSPGGAPGAQGTTATEEPPAGLEEPPPGLGEPPSGGEEPTRLVEPEGLRPEPPSREPDLGLPDLPEAPGGAEAAGGESLEDLIADEEPFPEDVATPPHAPSENEPFPEDVEAPHPSDIAGPPPVAPGQESLDELELDEGREPPLEGEEPAERPLEPSDSVPDPPPPPPDTGPEPPGRARGRVDVPTQEHPPPGDTGGLPPLPPEDTEYRPEPLEPAGGPEPEDTFAVEEPEDAEGSGGPALYDFETDEEPAEPAPDAGDEFEALGPAEEEAPYLDEEEPYDAEEPTGGTDLPPDQPFDEPGTEVRPSVEDEEDEDDLWFEKGPPKDFDFDD